MNIWSARLYLNEDMDDNLIFRFKYDKEDRDDYKDNGNNEWFAFEDWVSYRIPMNINVENSYGIFKAVQGFDRNLSKEEQEDVKEEMIEKIVEYLEFKKKQQDKFYNKRIKFMQKQ